MGILASEKFLRFFDSYGKVLIFMQNIHPCVTENEWVSNTKNHQTRSVKLSELWNGIYTYNQG